LGKEDYPTAYKIARKSVTPKKMTPTPERIGLADRHGQEIKQRDLALAELMATRANDATKGKDAAIIDTLARIRLYRARKKRRSRCKKRR